MIQGLQSLQSMKLDVEVSLQYMDDEMMQDPRLLTKYLISQKPFKVFPV